MADTKISALSAVATPAATDEFPVNQAGTSKKITLEQVAAFGASAPTVVSVGTEFHGTGVPTATLPGTHAADDILLLILESANESNVTAPAGYQQLGPQNGIGAAATAGSLKLHIFWKRDGGSESAPTIPDTGDHTYGVMLAVRGCPTDGDPFHFLGNSFQFTAGTTATSIATARTSVDNCLVLTVFGHAIDSASAQASAAANASLSSVTEAFDGATTDGIGGGIVVVSGVKATAGEVSQSSITLAASSAWVASQIAFLPAAATSNHVAARAPEVQVFLGSAADLDDTWVRPTGAVRVFAQICDGGGGGGGGNTTTTASGGGGGGGGGYDEAWYDAADLGASAVVHAGKGGPRGVALNAVGSLNAVSEFGKGGTIGPLIAARRAVVTQASAAATADGGNGGCGGGATPGPIGIQTTRRALNAANAAVPPLTIGAGGGSGTTAPVGGCEALWGGGGGESGSDSDAALSSLNNGNSLRGGGGGSGGRTNTNISGSGRGGGAEGVVSAQGAKGNNSSCLPYGGSGGVNGGSSVATGGDGGFPGGGGGGGGGVAGGFGGGGGHGCVKATTYF